ncbi:uncharacterized protein VTP21DRAFT_5732 [Calcarisporiella thermophila]|uniref:uncharacterized protein n=1 Tax=Calcarisporiella thermophila TaxID=911321 RepID=UPI003742CC31
MVHSHSPIDSATGRSPSQPLQSAYGRLSVSPVDVIPPCSVHAPLRAAAAAPSASTIASNSTCNASNFLLCADHRLLETPPTSQLPLSTPHHTPPLPAPVSAKRCGPIRGSHHQQHRFNPLRRVQTQPLPQSSAQEDSADGPIVRPFVSNLVDIAALVIGSIWPQKTINPKVLALRDFIEVTLRRSRTSYSTFQTALFYICRVRNKIVAYRRDDVPVNDLVKCGRRMFVGALIVANKFLQDKNYRNRAWSKITSLSNLEVNEIERTFLRLIDYNLYLTSEVFSSWTGFLLSQATKLRPHLSPQQSLPPSQPHQEPSPVSPCTPVSVDHGSPLGLAPSFSPVQDSVSPAQLSSPPSTTSPTAPNMGGLRSLPYPSPALSRGSACSTFLSDFEDAEMDEGSRFAASSLAASNPFGCNGVFTRPSLPSLPSVLASLEMSLETSAEKGAACSVPRLSLPNPRPILRQSSYPH